MITDYLIAFGATFAISIATSYSKDGFSTDIFLLSVAISICILAWIPIVPVYTVLISALILVGMLVKQTDSGEFT
jgi:hypothetical protein